MRGVRVPGSGRCIAGVLGALSLTGCVPSAYVYESPSPSYYGGSYGYYAAGGYYGYPGYYGRPYAPPRVVYVDHDHRGDDCRHESHRDRRPYDHRYGQEPDRRQGGDERRHDDRRDRRPPVRQPCEGKKCESPGQVPAGDREGEPRTPGRRRSTMRPHPADPP